LFFALPHALAQQTILQWVVEESPGRNRNTHTNSLSVAVLLLFSPPFHTNDTYIMM
jgi:hypothetical protein